MFNDSIQIAVILQCQCPELYEPKKDPTILFGHMVLVVNNKGNLEYRGFGPVLQRLRPDIIKMVQSGNITKEDESIIKNYLKNNCVDGVVKDDGHFARRSKDEEDIRYREWTETFTDEQIETILDLIQKDKQAKPPIQYAFKPQTYSEEHNNTVDNCVSWVIKKIRQPFTQEEILNVKPEVPPLVKNGLVILMEQYFDGKEVALWK